MGTPAFTLTIEELEALMRKVAREERVVPVSEESQVLTRKQTANLLQVHPNVISKYVRKFGLPAHHIGGEWKFLRSEVMEWIATRERVPAKGAA